VLAAGAYQHLILWDIRKIDGKPMTVYKESHGDDITCI
jgi:hypothetical protein